MQVMMRFLAEQEGKDKEDGDDGGDHASYDDAGEGLLGLGSDAVGEGGGKEAEAGGEAGHDDWTHLVDAAVLEASAVDAFALGSADPGHEDDTAESGDADERGEAYGGGDAEGGSGDEE